MTQNILPIFLTGYPCKYHCIYCNAPAVVDRTVSLRAADLRRSIDTWLAQDSCGQREIALYGNDPGSLDKSFFLQILELVSAYVEQDLVSGIRVSVRPDTVCRFPELFSYGIRVMELGVPSMDDRVLKIIRREHRAEVVLTAVNALRKRDIRIGIQTMVGLPEAGVSEAVCSAGAISRMHPDFVRIHPALVLAGTALETRFRNGRYHPMSLEAAVKLCADVSEIYRSNGIRIARCGFHIPEKCRKNVLVAGPYHPSFGTLVRSALCYREMAGKLEANPGLRVIEVPETRISEYIGYRKQNLSRLRARFHPGIRIIPSESAGN